PEIGRTPAVALGVLEQVREHLLQTAPVGEQRTRAIGVQTDTLVPASAQQLATHRRQVDHRGLQRRSARVEARDLQQVEDQTVERGDLVLERVDDGNDLGGQ